MIADDQTFYVGSHNLYEANLSEFGFIVDDTSADRAVVKRMLDTLWSPMWRASYRTAPVWGRPPEGSARWRGSLHVRKTTRQFAPRGSYGATVAMSATANSLGELIMKDTFHSRIALLLLALAVPACATDEAANDKQPVTRLAASESSNALGVMSWELHEEGEAMRIIGLDVNGQRTVEVVAQRDVARPDALVHVEAVYPERGTFDITRDGGDAGTPASLNGLRAAIAKDMATSSTPLTPAPFVEYLQGEGHVEMGWSMFGYRVNVDVNTFCGQGTRAYAEAYSNNGASCWVNRWTSNSPYDCRINLHYGIGGWQTDTCNWFVYTNI